MSQDFGRKVNALAEKYKKRVKAVGREAVQELISAAQVTRGEGGRMRVDTGFLRASIQGALGTMPRGPVGNPKRVDFRNTNQAAGENISSVLLRWDPTKPIPIYVGWTANYARVRESKDGFLRGAVENWDVYVERAVARAKAGGL